MLKIAGLDAGYGKFAAIQQIDLEVPPGRIVSIIGANGAGKSTLLKAVSGLIPYRSGRIMFEERNIVDLPADRIVGLGLCQVAEGRQIFAHMSVLDNIRLGAYLHYRRGRRQAIEKRIQQVHAMFPILHKRSKQIAGTLSGGEQQMLAIARALMTQPKLLLLDEPSMGLAPIIVQDILNIILQLKEMGTTILLVEQNARSALRISDFAYVLETGRVVLAGPASRLIDNDKVKAAYLGG